VKLIGLTLTLLAIAFFFYWAYGRKEPTPSADAPATSTTLGAPPPSDVASNAKAAAQHAQRQTCLAACASEERTCSATAAETPAIEACGRAKADCEARCP
jgi:hypothetical protein